MSLSVTPPEWKVRMVSCVPGSADGLRGDDADGLTELDQLVRRERQT